MPVADVARQMLDAYPREVSLDRGLLVSCIEACSDCAESCTQCADDCLGEEGVQDLTTCIRLCLDCADVCASTARVVGRRTGYNADVTGAVLRACMEACRACAEACAVGPLCSISWMRSGLTCRVNPSVQSNSVSPTASSVR